MKTLWAIILIFVLTDNLTGQNTRKNTFPIRITVCDSINHEPLFLATISLTQDNHKIIAGSSDAQGEYLFPSVQTGVYKLKVSFIGYKTYTDTIRITGDFSRHILLAPDQVVMQEVIVTARESHGMTSSSIIDRKAMEHLQPSSFSDLLELLPGGRSADPALNQVNPIRLREAGEGSSSSDYDVASRGVAFFINGTPINTGADMLYVSGEASTDDRKRSTVNRGVDMRSISTDGIEQVEIIRGIPSVEYGNLTSGIVKIKRKMGGNHFNARFKADESSKLVYLGKGFEFPKRQIKINSDIDWLDAKADPRDNLENYKRLTFSLRLEKTWKTGPYNVFYSTHADYNGSFNTEKIDPDINRHKEDSYKSRINRLSWINNIEWQSENQTAFFNSLSFNSSVSFSKDKVDEVRYNSLSRAMAAPNSNEAGEHDGVFLPFQFVGTQKVDNRPFGAYVRLTGNFRLFIAKTRQELKIGTDWQMDKNFGEGQLYDPLRPGNYTSISTRPRPYNDIPAGHDLSFFAEDYFTLPVSTHTLEIQAGVRASSLLNLPKAYKLHNKFYFDPRVNMKWLFPAFFIGDQKLSYEIGGGIGWHSMMPSLTQLYPNLLYEDIIQLNYYHNNPAYRRLQMITYIIDRTNPDLSAARNFKWEIRGNITYAENNLSVTYFKENMTSGFRTGTRLLPLAYKTYDNNSIDATTLDGPPDLSQMTYTQDTLMCIYGITTNGTKLRKTGVEFQFSSKRIPALATRITISGAYFRTVYSNSQGYYESSTKIINNRRLPYVGWYTDPDGYIRKSFNTNFMFDTHIPNLKLGFSLSAQCLWFSNQQTEWKSGIPEYYIDSQGNSYPYTEESSQDMYLQWLKKSYNEALFDRRISEAFNVNFNLKVTKQLYRDRINLALFVNRLISCHPDYTSNGVKVRQIGQSPYFGMELNFNI